MGRFSIHFPPTRAPGDVQRMYRGCTKDVQRVTQGLMCASVGTSNVMPAFHEVSLGNTLKLGKAISAKLLDALVISCNAKLPQSECHIFQSTDQLPRLLTSDY